MKFKHSRRLFSLVLTICLLSTVVGSAWAQDLGQTYTSPDGSLTFNYPDGWATTELIADFVFLGNSQDALDRVTGGSEDNSLRPGEIVYYVIGPTAAKLAFDADPTLGPVEALQALAGEIAGDDSEDPATVGEIGELTIGDLPAARATVTSAELDGLIVALKPTADTVILALLVTPPGESESAEPQFRAVLESIRYTPPAPPEPVAVGDLNVSFASPDGRVAAQLPEGWVGQENFGDYEFANSQATFDKYNEEFTVDPGNVIVTLITPATLRANYEAPTDDAQAAVLKLAEYWGMEGEIVANEVTQDGFTVFVVSSPDLFGFAYFLTFMVNGEVFAFRLNTAFGEDPTIWQNTLLAIAPTISYRTFEAPEANATINWRVLYDPNGEMAYVVISELELAADGTLFGMDTSSGAVYSIGLDGTISPIVPTLNFTASTYSSDFAVAPDGSFWVTDSSDYSVHHFGADGNEIGLVEGNPENPAYAVMVEFGPDGNLYVVDGIKNPNDEFITDSRVRVFDGTGTQVKEFVLDGTDIGTPSEFAIAPDGTLYVLGYSGVSAADLDGNARPVPAILRPDMPAQVEFAADGAPILSFDVTDYSTDTPVTYRSIVKYGLDGVPVAAFGTNAVDTSVSPLPEGELQLVNDFVVLPDGSIVVSDGYYPNAQLINAVFAQ